MGPKKSGAYIIHRSVAMEFLQSEAREGTIIAKSLTMMVEDTALESCQKFSQ